MDQGDDRRAAHPARCQERARVDLVDDDVECTRPVVVTRTVCASRYTPSLPPAAHDLDAFDALARGSSCHRRREQRDPVSACDERARDLFGEDLGTAGGWMGDVLPVEDQDAHAYAAADEVCERPRAWCVARNRRRCLRPHVSGRERRARRSRGRRLRRGRAGVRRERAAVPSVRSRRARPLRCGRRRRRGGRSRREAARRFCESATCSRTRSASPYRSRTPSAGGRARRRHVPDEVDVVGMEHSPSSAAAMMTVLPPR